ncbi:DUF411 domain-containing protein [Methylocystis parvus]|uniref:DUF411 domain-containing protein n=1 Tax=Methylocystis parvus TaxID=134 RepID=A0A6B8M298_9HYPH|nr:DUF411 domain-containing protein [Methylocystis parvus]QGM97934.1 DUF411 domain-containing protein [Methylocystis parvus]WBK01754.1 DUF411 domain-containing protein [Methylocystis parvus OBBP]
MSRLLSRREAALFLSAAGAALLPGAARAAESRKMVVHKSPTCGCCGGWAARMRAEGYVVEEINEADMKAVKARLGVPESMASCHTAELEGYVIEGHAPPQAVAKLLNERPKVTGVAAPGMPMGSPGMEMGEPEVYTLYLFDAAGAREFGMWLGDKPV